MLTTRQLTECIHSGLIQGLVPALTQTVNRNAEVADHLSFLPLVVDVDILSYAVADNDTLALRGNSIATKAVESYMKMVGHKVNSFTMFLLRLRPNDCIIYAECSVVKTATWLRRFLWHPASVWDRGPIFKTF